MWSFFLFLGHYATRRNSLEGLFECAFVLFESPHEIALNVFIFCGKDVLVKPTVAPQRDQLDDSSSLINAPIRISLDSTNMDALIFLAYHFFS